MKPTLKFIAKTLAALTVIAIIAALLLLIGAQYWSGAEVAVVSIGSEEIPMVGVFGAGIATLIVAWAAVAIAILIGVFATIFALVVTALALAFSALLVGFPFIIGGVVVWLVMRRKQRAVAAMPTISNTPPPVTSA